MTNLKQFTIIARLRGAEPGRTLPSSASTLDNFCSNNNDRNNYTKIIARRTVAQGRAATCPGALAQHAPAPPRRPAASSPSPGSVSQGRAQSSSDAIRVIIRRQSSSGARPSGPVRMQAGTWRQARRLPDAGTWRRHVAAPSTAMPARGQALRCRHVPAQARGAKHCVCPGGLAWHNQDTRAGRGGGKEGHEW